MKIIMAMSMIITFMFIMTKHPLSMGFNLLSQSVMIALITGFMSINFWYSYILFIIMVGGMLVLFIYMTCVASNEKFSIPSMISMIFIVILTLMISLISDINSSMLEEKIETWNLSLMKFFSFPQSIILITIMMYLLLALIASVKITKIEMGPLRKSF